MTSTADGTDELIGCLDRAVGLEDPDAVTRQVKTDLERLIGAGRLRLDRRFRAALPDTYARRLLHRDPGLRYTAVVMTWGPGQGTSLHDHAGIWCVEGVIEGSMHVTRYDLASPADDGRFAFVERQCVRAEVGSAGSLIPPFEYHVLANALPDHPSITLHVYGGEMTGCHIYERCADGLYEQVYRELGYHD